MGASAGIDLETLLAPGRRAEEALGGRLRSKFLPAGAVAHEGIEYDKQEVALGPKK